VSLVKACADAVEEVRESVVAALEELGPAPPSDVPALVSLLASPHSDVGYWAATLLGRLGPDAATAVPALTATLSGSAHLAVRQRAAWALGEIGPAAAAARDALAKASKSDDPRLARLAQQAINQLGG
jgi:HEAT repeat protein